MLPNHHISIGSFVFVGPEFPYIAVGIAATIVELAGQVPGSKAVLRSVEPNTVCGTSWRSSPRALRAVCSTDPGNIDWQPSCPKKERLSFPLCWPQAAQHPEVRTHLPV